jgi:hypothetical protein
MWSVLLLACVRRAPSASVVGARLEGVDWDTISGTVSVAVDNPTWAAMPVSGFTWSLGVDGRVVAEGARSGLDPLVADGTTVVEVPVVVAWRDLATRGPAFAAPWTFAAVVDLDTPLGLVSVPVERTVRLPAVDAPRLFGAGLRLDGSAVVLDVWLGAPRFAGFGLASLGWRVDLAGRSIGTGALLPGVSEEGGALHLLTRFDGAALAAAGWATLSGRGLSLGLELAGAAITPFGEVPFSANPTIRVGG